MNMFWDVIDTRWHIHHQLTFEIAVLLRASLLMQSYPNIQCQNNEHKQAATTQHQTSSLGTNDPSIVTASENHQDLLPHTADSAIAATP